MNTRRILIVDDDPGLRKTLSDILRARGYAPVAAARGQTALNMIEEERPAVAVIDLRLGDMSGLEVMERIKERSPGTECIVVTGYASQASAIEAVNLGAYSYVQKPYDMEQLLVAIRRAVEKREAEEALEKAAEEWRRTFDTMSDMVTILDSDFRIVRANRAAARAFGYEPEDLVGKKCYRVFHGLDCPMEDCPFNRSLQSGEVESSEIWEPTIDKALLVTANPIRDAEGRMIGTVHVMRDITERKRTEATWRALNAAAAALQRAGLSQAEIYQAAAEQLVALGLRGAVCLFDEATDTFVFEHFFIPAELLRTLERLTGVMGAGFRFPRAQVPACARVIESRQAVYVADSLTHIVAKLVPDSVSGLAARVLEMVGPANTILAPLWLEGGVIGLLQVASDWLTEADMPAITAFADQLSAALENARLYQDVGRRAEETAALLSTARAVSSLELDAVLKTIASQAKALFKADGSRIHLLEPDGKTLRCVIALHDRAEAVMALRPKVGQGMTGRVALKGVPELIPNTLADPDGIQVPGTPVEPEAMALIPLKVRERVIGVMTVSRLGEERPFIPADLTFLTAFADQAAVAIENARLFDETRRRAEELAALSDVSTALRTARTVEEMLPIILDETLEVMATETGALFLLDKVGDELIVQVARGRMAGMAGLRLPREGSRTVQCLETGQPQLGVELPPSSRMAAALTGQESSIQLPLRAAGEPIGVMHICFAGPHTFDDSERRLLTAIADMAGNAVHRASLFEELEHRVHELEALFEVGQAVTASLRVQDVLDLVARVAPEVLHAEGSYLFLWDEREKRLVLRAVGGVPPEVVGRVKYRQGEGLAGWVFLEGKVANVPDVAADPRWKREAEQEAVLPSGEVHSALVVPLIVRDKTLGVLRVVNKTADGRRPTGGEEATVVVRPSSVVGFSAADESLLTALAGHAAVAIESARLYEDVRGLSLGAIRSLATAIDARDPYTRGHSEGVTELAVRLARELGWGGADLEMLEFAALLHDVGKVAVPDTVLRKKEPLSAEEWNLIHLHPYHSAQIVKAVKALYRIVPWVYHHQERWDGTGYPDGLRGEKIPLASRIIAVADAYNAMTTKRPYRGARSREEAVEELRRCAGTQFDPQVVEVFLRILDL